MVFFGGPQKIASDLRVVRILRATQKRFAYCPKRIILDKSRQYIIQMCQGRLTPNIGDGHPTFNDGNPYNGYIKLLRKGLIKGNQLLISP